MFEVDSTPPTHNTPTKQTNRKTKRGGSSTPTHNTRQQTKPKRNKEEGGTGGGRWTTCDPMMHSFFFSNKRKGGVTERTITSPPRESHGGRGLLARDHLPTRTRARDRGRRGRVETSPVFTTEHDAFDRRRRARRPPCPLVAALSRGPTRARRSACRSTTASSRSS